MKTVIYLLVLSSSYVYAQSEAPSVQAPKGAKVFFVEPKNGAHVSGKFKVKFGVEKIKIRPALEDVNDHMSGHHHLIVDGAAIPAGETIPADDKHIHFGKGQTETEISLSPGKHILTMQFADGAHRSYGKDLSTTITVEAK